MNETDFSKAKFDKNVRQVIFKFEKIVDSLISDKESFTPFISYEKKISTFEENTEFVNNLYTNFKIQCLKIKLNDTEKQSRFNFLKKKPE